MGWIYLSIPNLQRCSPWSVVMGKYLQPTLYWACCCLSILGLNLSHVSKGAHRVKQIHLRGVYHRVTYWVWRYWLPIVTIWRYCEKLWHIFHMYIKMSTNLVKTLISIKQCPFMIHFRYPKHTWIQHVNVADEIKIKCDCVIQLVT